jgi:hypothetical protein
VAQQLKLQLYCEAECTSARSELAPIAGGRVAVVARFQDAGGNWSYTVYPAKSKPSPTFTCLEEELRAVDPEPLVADSELLANIISQTADLRYSSRHDGLRRLLQERGYDAARCLMISVDQGDDVIVTLVLPDLTVVKAEYRIDPETRQAIRLVAWDVKKYTGREIELCRELLNKSDTSEFDAAVRRYSEDDE